jgi:hypothetical protein
MSQDGVDDRIDLSTAARLLDRSQDQPIATCPRDGEPLIATMEFDGAEFYCQKCGSKLGFLSPTPATWTEELQARHDQLRAQYEAERDSRDLERYGESCDREYVWPPVAKISDHERAELRGEGHMRPFLDGRWVTTTIYEAFQREWSEYYQAHPEEHEHPEGVNLCSVEGCAHYRERGQQP